MLLRLLPMCTHTDHLEETVFILEVVLLRCGRLVVGRFSAFELIHGKSSLLSMGGSFCALVARILIGHHVVCFAWIVIGLKL